MSQSTLSPSAGRRLAGGVPHRDDAGRVLRVTRLGVFVLLVLALANGLFLYLLPGRALVDYAWAIKPPINAACIGAGYLAGCVATGLVVLRATTWRSLRILPPALATLAITVLAATLIHEDRFFWAYVPTWLWTAVYATVPLMVPAFWWLQERGEAFKPEADSRLRPLRVQSAVMGAVLAAIGGALFLAPVEVSEIWPWPLTPLLARVIAGWYLLSATVLVMAAVSLRRSHEIPIPYATLATWSALLLVLPVVHAGDLADRPVALAVWVIVHVGLLVLSLAALIRALRAMRSGAQTL